MKGKRVNSAILSSFKIFKTLSTEERKEIADLVLQYEYPAESIVISCTETDTNVFFIMSGSVRASNLGANGRPVQHEDLSAGEMFGELSAIDPESRVTDCWTLVDSIIVRMNAQVFRDCINKYPSVRDAVMKRLAQLARQQTRRIIECYVKSVPERVRAELVRMAKKQNSVDYDISIPNPPTHADIAERIGAHREGVTRELGFLHKAGIITWDRHTHVVHDLSKLS